MTKTQVIRFSTLEQVTHVSINVIDHQWGSIGLSEEMQDEGYTDIENIDTSIVVIRQMQEMYKGRYDGMPYKQMDVRDL